MELTANIGISRGKCHLRHKKAPKRFVFPRYMLTTSNKPGAFVGKCAIVSLSRSRNNHIGATCFLIPLRFRSSPPREEKTAAGNQITTPYYLLPIRIILPKTSDTLRKAGEITQKTGRKTGSFLSFSPLFPGKCPAHVAILPNSDNFGRVVKVPFAVLRSLCGDSHSTQRGQSHNTALRHPRKRII